MSVREQRALERREEGVHAHHQRRGRGERGQTEPAGPGIRTGDHQPDDRRGHQQEGLLGEHRDGETCPAPRVRPQPTRRRGREDERREEPRDRQVVQQHHPLLGDRERTEAEQQHRDRCRDLTESDAARQHIEQRRADEERHEHEDPALRDGHRVAAESSADPEPPGQLDPTQRRMVVPVRVMTQGAARHHRPRLGHVCALVVEEPRRPGEPHRVDISQQGEQPGDGGDAPDVEPPAGPWELCGGEDRVGGDRLGRYQCAVAVQLDDHGVAVRIATGISSRRCAPTWAVFSQVRTPRVSRATARTDAAARTRWYGRRPTTSRA